MEQQDNNADVVINASWEDYQTFLASPVWQDLRTELGVQKRMIEDALADARDPIDIYRWQGRLEACKDFLAMPEDFLKLIEERVTQLPVPDDSEATNSVDGSDDYYNELLDKYQGE